MKKIAVFLIMIFALATNLSAQQKPGKAVIATPNVHCESCKERIENYVSRQYGVTSVKVDLKKKTTTVTWIPDRTNIEEIKTHIANRGYDADDVEAEPSMYFRLPKACQVKKIVTSPVVDSTTESKPAVVQ